MLGRAARRRRRAAGRPAADPRAAGGGRADVVAFAGPLPPTPSGIATYDRAVLDGLRRVGFVDREPVEPIWPIEPRHHASIRTYRLGVYQLGNNVEHHLDVYRLAWAFPGLVVLHDLAMDDFVRGLQSSGDRLGFVAMREALAAARRLRASGLEVDRPLRLPWSAAIARHARGIVVHSTFARRYLEAFGCRTPVFVVPHPPPERPDAVRAAEARAGGIRAAAEGRGARTLVVAAGDLNEAKRLDAVAAAVGRLGPHVHLAVVGRRVATFDPVPALREAGLGPRLALHPDVSDADFLAWLAAADVVVDLRFPHRGEVSGTLARAMQLGRATLVSATGSYLDEPAGTVASVAPGPPDVEELARRLRELDEDPARRASIGRAAREHAARLAADEATARGYAEAIEATAAVVHDPVGAPMARWARALVELGVTEEQVAAGWGLRYARALEDLTRPP